MRLTATSSSVTKPDVCSFPKSWRGDSYETGHRAVSKAPSGRAERHRSNLGVLPIRSEQIDRYLVKRLGTRFLPGDVSREHIRNYLMWLADVGHKRPNGPASRARALAAVRSFFRYAHHAGLLRDNPAADIALPRTRVGRIRF